MEPSVSAGKEVALSFIKHVLAGHRVTSAADDMSGTVVESKYDNAEHTPHPPSKTVVKASHHTINESKDVRDDLGVMTKADVEALIECRRTKCTRILQLQIVKAIKSPPEVKLHARYFNSNEDLKTAVFKAVGQALSKVVRSGSAHNNLRNQDAKLRKDRVCTRYDRPVRAIQHRIYCPNQGNSGQDGGQSG